MLHKIILPTFIICLLLNSCKLPNSNSTNTDTTTVSVDSASTIPYTEAQRYFVNNTYKEGQLTNPKITNQDSFNHIFGMGAVMGPDGKPTSIDFATQYAIAVIKPETDVPTTLSVNKLTQNGNNITLNYKTTSGEKTTYIMQPFLLIIVDKKFDGEVSVVEEK
jgi:hypothetical protein